jgi:hypothetical protein
MGSDWWGLAVKDSQTVHTKDITSHRQYFVVSFPTSVMSFVYTVPAFVSCYPQASDVSKMHIFDPTTLSDVELLSCKF